MSKNEKYPQIVLGTDNVYHVLIAPGVEVNFESQESIEEFCKNKNFTIKGEYIPPQRDRKQVFGRNLMDIISELK